MATTFKWVAPEALTAYLGTELNSLADSTSDTTGFSAVGAEIANETALYQYIALQLVVATQGGARSAGAFVAVYINYAADGSTYDDTSNKAFSELLTVFQLDAATTARTLTKVNLAEPLAPGKAATIDIAYRFTVPDHGADRMGRDGALWYWQEASA